MSSVAAYPGVSGQASFGAVANGKVGSGRHWFGVEFRHLDALATVAREGSFRRAADRLGYVQSAISGQIAQLEAVVGEKLVERSSGAGGVTLTDAGEVLLDHVHDILARFDAARFDLRALAQDTGMTARIGVPHDLAPRSLPHILAAFTARYPHATVSLTQTCDTPTGIDQLANGDLDLVIAELPIPDGPFHPTTLIEDPYVLILPADSPLARQTTPVTASQLAGLKLLIPTSPQQDRLAAHLRAHGINPQPWLSFRGPGLAQALVSQGLGGAILPNLAIDPANPDTIVVITAPGVLPERHLALITHREREYPPTLQTLIQHIAETFAEPPTH